MNQHVATPIPTVMLPASKLRYASEAPKDLGLQVRKSNDQQGIGELEASIRTHGIIVPLVYVSHKGQLYVTAGNRRLKLFRKIHGDDTEQPLQAVDSAAIKGDAREIAMATNLGLPPHPVDRYEVIALLVKEGMSHADAQAHFDLSARAFNQIMRLGTMSPVIRNAWRDNDIDADVVKAFALTVDPAMQEKAFKELSKGDRRVYAHDVRTRLIGKQHGVGRLVEFVGLAACEQAGIVVDVDLFGLNHRIGDGGLKTLNRLVDDKTTGIIKQLEEVDGWSWAATQESITDLWKYGDISPSKSNPTKEEKFRLEQIEALLKEVDGAEAEALEAEADAINLAVELRGFSKEARAKSGCLLTLENDGKLKIEYGKTKPSEKAKIERQERQQTAGDKPGKSSKPKHDVKSAALGERLSTQLTKAAAAAIVKEPSLAIAAIIAGIASHDFAVGIRINGDQSRGTDFVKTFESALKGSRENRDALLAQIAARALMFVSHNPDSPPMRNNAIAAICNQLAPGKFNEALREQFDAKNYFESTDKASIEQAVREAMGDDHADKVAKMKGPEAVKFASANVPQTKWLPPWLRTANYDGPSKGTKKARPPASKAKKPKTGAEVMRAKKAAKKRK